MTSKSVIPTLTVTATAKIAQTAAILTEIRAPWAIPVDEATASVITIAIETLAHDQIAIARSMIITIVRGLITIAPDMITIAGRILAAAFEPMILDSRARHRSRANRLRRHSDGSAQKERSSHETSVHETAVHGAAAQKTRNLVVR